MSDPSSEIIENETNHLFLSFCTFVVLLKGKKLSIQNVFVQVLQNEKLKKHMIEMLDLENDFDLVRTFLEFDPSIAKSKQISKYINSQNRKKSKK